MQVELISVQTDDNVVLHGALRRPAAGATPRLGLDAMIELHGVADKFYGDSFFDGVGDGLLEAGCAVLRVNNRGHDSVYNRAAPRNMSYDEAQAHRRSAGPLGAACEVVDDCRRDWKAWIDFAAEQGYRRIGLWGHSLGAVKTIYYLAKEGDARVVLAVASSPPRFSHQAYLEAEVAAEFRANFEAASALVAAGKGEEFLRVNFPTVGVFMARTYVDKYGPDARYDIFAHLPAVKLPLLLTLGELETEINFRRLGQEGPSLNASLPLVQYREIAGADHAYRGRVQDLWTATRDWLESVQPALSRA